MKKHRHEGDGEHIFVDADGSQYVCAQGYSQLAGKIPKGEPCPDCEELRKKGYVGADGFGSDRPTREAAKRTGFAWSMPPDAVACRQIEFLPSSRVWCPGYRNAW